MPRLIFCWGNCHRSGRSARRSASRGVLALLLVHLAAAADARQLLVLYSNNRLLMGNVALDSALRQTLNANPGQPVQIFSEFLDEPEFGGDRYELTMSTYLRDKYADRPPDAVLIAGNTAMRFILRYRGRLFPAVPIVHVAVTQEVLQSVPALPPDIVGVPVAWDFAGTVKQALKWHPRATHLVIVFGASQQDVWEPVVRPEITPILGHVQAEYLVGLTLPALQKRLRELGSDSVVLTFGFFKDGDGRSYQLNDSAALVAAASAAPVYAPLDTLMGTGVVGGRVLSYEQIGRQAGEILERLFSGQPDWQRMPPAPASVLQVDWRQIKRWGIDPKRLPAGTEIHFRPPPLWDEHRALVATAISIFLLQTALLTGLVWQRVGRRRAEAEALTLSGRLITAHEDERRWLARELHDDITQRLAGLAIAAAKLPGSESAPMDSDPRPSIRLELVRLSDDIHDLSYRLHPSVIEDVGLVDALKAECERIARAEFIRVDVQSDRLPQGLPNEVALGIYRIAQEALRNIARHAKANLVQLSLALIDGGLRLAVSDNGAGFESGLEPARASLGHASMRERIRLLGGKLEIRSTPGRGTTVVAWVPIPKAAL
jgi:signal transduction histidine kinase